MLDVLGPLWFFLPAAVANMAPVVARNMLGLGRPIDAGRMWRGKPILGKNKTWQGLLVGTGAGGLFFLAQAMFYKLGVLHGLAVIDYATAPWWLGFSMGFGALFGDLAKSFLKRRVGIKPGQSWLGIDQIDYIAGGILFSVWFVALSLAQWLVICVGYLVLVVLVNHLAFYTGIRAEKW